MGELYGPSGSGMRLFCPPPTGPIHPEVKGARKCGLLGAQEEGEPKDVRDTG